MKISLTLKPPLPLPPLRLLLLLLLLLLLFFETFHCRGLLCHLTGRDGLMYWCETESVCSTLIINPDSYYEQDTYMSCNSRPRFVPENCKNCMFLVCSDRDFCNGSPRPIPIPYLLGIICLTVCGCVLSSRLVGVRLIG